MSNELRNFLIQKSLDPYDCEIEPINNQEQIIKTKKIVNMDDYNEQDLEDQEQKFLESKEEYFNVDKNENLLKFNNSFKLSEYYLKQFIDDNKMTPEIFVAALNYLQISYSQKKNSRPVPILFYLQNDSGDFNSASNFTIDLNMKRIPSFLEEFREMIIIVEYINQYYCFIVKT